MPNSPNANRASLVSLETQLVAQAGAIETTVAGHEARIASLETEPPAHGSTHLPGGADDIPVATELSPGFLPTLSGTATEYLDGTGVWSTPGGGGGGATDLGYTASTRVLTSSTGLDVTLPLFTSTDAGLTPASSGGTTNFLRADGSWSAPSGGSTPTATPTASSVPLSLASGQLDTNWIRQTTTCDYRASSAVSPGQCYIANVSTGVALSTKALAANTEYWIPYVAPKSGAVLSSVLIQVSTASAGTSVIVGLYLCKSNPSNALWPNFGDFRPVGSPIVQQTQSTAATGTFTLSSLATTLTTGFTYWFCILSSGAPTLRGGGTNQTNCNLGWQLPTGTTTPNAITHWTAARTFGSGLRTGLLGTETFTAGTAAFPAVFIVVA